MMATTRLLTAEDIEVLPEDERRFELIDGEPRFMPFAGFEPSVVGARVVYHLLAFVLPRRLGAVTGADGSFVISQDPDVVLVPDAAFVRGDRLPALTERGRFYRGVPDLAVEVRSPSDQWRDIEAKVGRYLAAGTRLVWVIEPTRKTATVWTADAPREPTEIAPEGVLDGGDVLTGFGLRLADLFG